MYYDLASSSNTTFCLNVTNSYGTSFVNNRLTNSPHFGIQGVQLHDCAFKINTVHNANQGTGRGRAGPSPW